MTKTLEFTGSTINAGNYSAFSFYLTAEGASSSIINNINLKSIYFPSTTGYGDTGIDVYMNIWEGNGTDAYTYLGSSTNADHCSHNEDATWLFSNITLSPSKYYLVLVSSSEPSNSYSSGWFRMPVYAMNEATTNNTMFSTISSNPPTGSQSWAVHMTLTYEDISIKTDTNAKLNIKIMTTQQLNNEEKDPSTFYINDDTKQLYLGTKLLVGNSSGGDDASWGNISGTLSDQTDLQTALNAKSKVSIVNWNTSTTTDLDTLIINQLTKQQYDGILEKDDTQLYMITSSDDDRIVVDDELSNSSTNPVENQVITNAISNKQDTLVSGTNIKTINGDSILGSGNLVISSDDASWGNISGTLSDQTDLQAVLTNKVNISDIDQTYNASSTNAQSGTAVANAISSAISSVYKPAGSSTFDNLPTPSSSNLGNVYNMSESFTIDNRFVEYDSSITKTYPAGTNVVVVNTGSSTYKFDILSGFIDLTNYATIASLSNVATSGEYSDLLNKPTIPTNVTDLSDASNYATIASLSNVAFSGDYNDLTNKPSGPGTQVQSDWNETNTSNASYILNKPTIPDAQVQSDWNAVSGMGVILNKPTIPDAQVQSDWNAVSGMGVILNKPTLADVATTGEYSDLLNKPTIPTNVTDLSDASNYLNILDTTSINLANVATTGEYSDLLNIPDIAQSDWNETNTSNAAYILNKPVLSNVAFSGDYNDLSNIPSEPLTQVQSDWNETNTSNAAYILNKPEFANVAMTGEYSDLLNTPTIDQTYDALSTNAQSGTAVAEGLAEVTELISWGNIAGTLSDQTDLQDALDDKSKVSLVTWENSSSTSNSISELNINELTQAEYNQLLEDDLIKDDELYMITDDEFVKPNDLANIAFSGDYNDLTNTPAGMTVDQVFNAMSNNSQSGVAIDTYLNTYVATSAWGKVTGTLSDQTDLQDALDEKSTVSLVSWENSSSTSNSMTELNINELTQAEYNQLLEDDLIKDDELYMITDDEFVKPSDLANVATTGDYNDLVNIPSGMVVDQVFNAMSNNSQSGVAIDTYLNTYDASTSWGKISGSISNQSDLKTVLDEKSTVSLVNWENSSSTTNSISELNINQLTQDEYNQLLENDLINDDELYMITDDEFVSPSDLANVATTGNYNDLNNRPTIPVVDPLYNGTSTNAQSGVAIEGMINAKFQVVNALPLDPTPGVFYFITN